MVKCHFTRGAGHLEAASRWRKVSAARTASLRMARRASSPRYIPETIFSKRWLPALGVSSSSSLSICERSHAC